MIIRTKIEWSQDKQLDPVEKEKIEARAEFESSYDPYEDLTEIVEKEAIIDTIGDKLYVQIEEDKICMLNLLSGEYILTNTSIKKFQERVIFRGTLDDIYTLLTNNN